MKIDVTEDGAIRLKQIYNSIVCQADDNQIAICERDGSFEIGVKIKDAKAGGYQYRWYVVNGEEIKLLGYDVTEIMPEDMEELARMLEEAEEDEQYFKLGQKEGNMLYN